MTFLEGIDPDWIPIHDEIVLNAVYSFECAVVCDCKDPAAAEALTSSLGGVGLEKVAPHSEVDTWATLWLRRRAPSLVEALAVVVSAVSKAGLKLVSLKASQDRRLFLGTDYGHSPDRSSAVLMRVLEGSRHSYFDLPLLKAEVSGLPWRSDRWGKMRPGALIHDTLLLDTYRQMWPGIEAYREAYRRSKEPQPPPKECGVVTKLALLKPLPGAAP